MFVTTKYTLIKFRSIWVVLLYNRCITLLQLGTYLLSQFLKCDDKKMSLSPKLLARRRCVGTYQDLIGLSSQLWPTMFNQRVSSVAFMQLISEIIKSMKKRFLILYEIDFKGWLSSRVGFWTIALDQSLWGITYGFLQKLSILSISSFLCLI